MASSYQIARSLRFRAANSSYLSRTPGASGNSQKFTMRVIAKRALLAPGASMGFISACSGGSNLTRSDIRLDNESFSVNNVVTSFTTNLDANPLWRDPTKFFEFICAVDTTQATAANRVHLYIDGVEYGYGANSATTYPAQNDSFYFNQSGVPHVIGAIQAPSNSAYFDGYMADFFWIDGAQLTPSSFSQTDPVTGAWVPKLPAGLTYGTNGFHLDFHDNSSTTNVCLDSSGNGNNYTPNNISVTAGVTNDSLFDTPTNYTSGRMRGNFATLNPLMPGAPVLADGNLRLTDGQNNMAVSNQGAQTGKVAYQAIFTGGVNEGDIGLLLFSSGGPFSGSTAYSAYQGGVAGAIDLYSYNGVVHNEVTSLGSFGTFAANDKIQWFIDVDAGNVYLGKNGTLLNSGSPIITGKTGKVWFPYVGTLGSGGDPTGVIVDFGQGDFDPNSILAGYGGFCTQNLPDPAIKKPNQYFDANARTGNGSTFSVSGKGFQPDLVWSKGRTAATAYAKYDSARGATIDMDNGDTPSETTQATGLTSFNSDGFSGGALAKLNTIAPATYVDWMWKKGAIPGFDIVTWTGNGAGTRSLSHSLGAIPAVIWVAPRSGSGEQQMKHQKMTAANVAWPGITNQQQTSPSYGIIDDPSSSTVFGLTGTGTNVNTNGNLFIAYLWAEVAGFSKFGSYTGNGSTDGPFVWCGFKPRWLMVKRIDAAGSWYIWDAARDTFNPVAAALLGESTAAEAVTADLDFTAGGFKCRNSSVANVSTGNYIFMAFADIPFKYSASDASGGGVYFPPFPAMRRAYLRR